MEAGWWWESDGRRQGGGGRVMEGGRIKQTATT